MVKAIESYEEFQSLINGPEPVVVDYWATWCGPCKMISPHFAKMEEKFPGMKFVKVDIDDQQQIAQEQGIRAMPTFIVYKNGKPEETLTGAAPAKLTALIEKHSA